MMGKFFPHPIILQSSVESILDKCRTNGPWLKEHHVQREPENAIEINQETSPYGSAWPATCSSLESESSSLNSSSLDFSSVTAPMSSGLAYFSRYSVGQRNTRNSMVRPSVG